MIAAPDRGRFVVVDGVDGAGKSTQIERLRAAIEALGHTVHRTAEPSDWPVGALIRRYLRRQETQGLPNWGAMALLFAADRLQHLEHEIEPALARGAVVLCDRYDASSIAYQSATAPDRGDDDALMQWIADANGRARRPDLTLLLDLDPEIAASRRASRGGEAELFERLDLQRRVRAQYRKIAQVRPHDRIVVIDAERSVDEVHTSMLAAVRAILD